MGWTVDLPTTLYIAPTRPDAIDPRCFTQLGSYEFQNILNEVKGHKHVAIDTETTGLIRWKDVPLYWSLAYGQRRITLHGSCLTFFQEAFDDQYKEWIFANAKYDAHILANVGIKFAGRLNDTQVMHALLYEEKSHALKDMADHLFGMRWGDFTDLFGKIGKKQSAEERIRTAERENMGMLVEYAANDAWGTLAIHEKLKAELEAAHTHSLFWNVYPYINTLWDYYYKVESRYTKVLWKMERRGIKVDVERFDAIRPQAEAELLRIQQEISNQVGFVFNPNSNDQKKAYFFDQLGLTPIKWTKGGKSGVRAPSVDADVMEQLAETNAVAKLMQDYSERAKLLSTYIIGLREHCDPHGRIHTSYNQHPRTGRLSSSEPNLQNCPKPENDKWNLRGSFIAEKGKKLICKDYEQLEMRLLAAASLEEDMINIFKRGEDIHMGNAAMIFGLPYDDIVLAKKIDKEVKSGVRPEGDLNDYVKKCLEGRFDAKTLGFGLIYGMGPNKLANALKCTLQEAKAKIATFMARYTAVDKFLQECVEESSKTGYAFTVLGRRRAIPELQSYRRDERSKGERLAVNTPIQGCIPGHVRILTKGGYLPIAEAPESGTVWTGTAWAPYRRINRGKYQRAQLKLSNGQTLDCDTRHKLLVATTEEYAFKEWDDLKIGDRVCMSMVRPLEFGVAPNGATTEDFYWMGYATGNGWTSSGTTSRGRPNTLSITFGTRAKQYNKEAKAQEFIAYINTLGLRTQKPQVHKNKITITIENAQVRNLWRGFGFTWGCAAHTKRVPQSVWTASLELRQKFVRGFLDADGQADHEVPNLHLCQKPILEEMLILLRTLGVESTLRGPYVWEDSISFRLDMNKQQLADLGYGWRGHRTCIPDMPIPRSTVDALLTLNKKFPRGSHSVLQSRLRRGGSVGVYTARDMFGEEVPLYATREVVEKRVLQKEEVTYTLSVDDPSHRFDSEGVISKNSAADVVKMAQINIDDLGLDRIYGYEMLLQVHDEIVGECPEETVEKVKLELRDAMEFPFVQALAVHTAIDMGVADNWGAAK